MMTAKLVLAVCYILGLVFIYMSLRLAASTDRATKESLREESERCLK